MSDFSAILISTGDIVETVREPLLVLDAKLRIRLANRSFLRDFHVTEQDTVGTVLHELGNGQWNIPALRKLLEEILPTKTAFDDFEVVHKFPLIGQRTMLLNARCVQNDQRECELILLAIEDITERRRLEAERHELETRFTSLVKNIRDHSIFALDTAGRITSWNREAEKILRFSEAEALGQHFSIIFSPEDQQNGIPEQELRIALSEGRAEDERWHLRKGGEPFWALGIVTPIYDESGKHTGFSKILRDMTERKRMEAELEVSEIRYRRLFEAAKDGILILDTAHGKIEDANPFMSDLLGYSKEDFIGKELWEIGLLNDASASRAMVHELKDKQYVRYDYLPLETTTGRKVEVEIVANVYQEDHHPVIQCNIRDITERSQLEQKTKDQANSLADLSRRKDEFLAMLSHELRNPLAPIQNAVHLLRLQQDRSPLQVEAHGMIERQVAQLTRLVDDLLEVSRITSGRIHLQEERVDLRGVVDRAIETTQPQASQKGQSVEKLLPDEPVWVYGDPVRLEQVVVNLLNNASKYTDRGRRIWVGLKQEGNETVLRVRDNGVGIAPEMIPRIFDLFTQADKSLHRSQGGLGIGLALVQSLVTMHHGLVEVKSSLGQGSEFIVTLPLDLTHAPTTAAVENMPAPSHALKVLVVDDNQDAAKSVAMLLRTYGHDARLAYDGASAMQVALEYGPDVILLDIGLPVVSGYEVAKWIRQEPTLKGVVLVALTGYGQESDRQRTQEAGFDHHLTKPADFAKMEAILATVAKR